MADLFLFLRQHRNITATTHDSVSDLAGGNTTIRFALLLFITSGHSQLAHASICHDTHLPLLYLVLRLINWLTCDELHTDS